MVREVRCFGVAFAAKDFTALSDAVLWERLLGEHSIGDVRGVAYCDSCCCCLHCHWERNIMLCMCVCAVTFCSCTEYIFNWNNTVTWYSRYIVGNNIETWYSRHIVVGNDTETWYSRRIVVGNNTETWYSRNIVLGMWHNTMTLLCVWNAFSKSRR